MGAFYSNTIAAFIEDDNDLIIGSLTKQAGLAGFYQQLHAATLSYVEEIDLLKSSLNELTTQLPKSNNFGILLEYPIARREKRIDAVILAYDLIIIVEFKVGKSEYLNADKDQLIDYCLDLRDFHFESRDKKIIPVLVAPDGRYVENKFTNGEDWVKDLALTNAKNFTDNLIQIINFYEASSHTLDYKKWELSNYSPTPTIIEVARALYEGKSVVEITRSHADADTLMKTSESVINAIELAKNTSQKIICFITGVPGAGKTLAGLNIAHHKKFQNEKGSVSTFLSGNAPLIKVLSKALSDDAYNKVKKVNPKAKKKDMERSIAFIENAHSFFESYFDKKPPNKKIPNNRIVIFDEAQRAWNAKQSKKKFQRDFSEPEMMFEIMNRHKDWAVIVALVGGGQEINTGEAGLPEWGRIIEKKFSDWTVYISPQLKIGNHSTGNLSLFNEAPINVNIIEDKNLHLGVSLRSYKAEELSYWVHLVLTNQPTEAYSVCKEKLTNYKIVLSRDLQKAKDWLNSKCKGSRRMGLVASSVGRRLRPYGLDVTIELEVAEWFLNGRNDIRSSYYLEIPATEFKIQGLELDWVGVCWDLDLFRSNDEWDFKSFSGTKWNDVKGTERRNYAINRYRVLLTRAREGMVIFVPPGDKDDATRNPEYYNGIANYLKICGVPEI